MDKKRCGIKFGTDGWRAVISDDFTFDNVRRVGAAVADYYNRQSGKQANRQTKIAVGYDTRFLSETYARLISEVLSSKGIAVTLSDRAIPTPALSFAVKRRRLNAGVMITASHNPAIYNGIKIKTHSGGAAPSEVTREIEKALPSYSSQQATRKPIHPNPAIIRKDLTRDYVRFLRSYINLALLKKARFDVLVDAMYGSGNGFIADVVSGTGIRVGFTRNQINPSFDGLRPEPVLENLKPTIAKLKEKSYDLGLVLDGDADRIAGFAGRGEFIHPQKILGLLILHLVRNRGMKGGVVKTIAGTTLIDKITACLGLSLYETPVGFKYISELMEKEDILIGGEEAGGMGFKGYIPERDGSLAGLLLLEMMAYQGKPMIKLLNEMEKEFGRYYYLREDIRLHKLKKQAGRDLSLRIRRFKSKRELSGKRVIQVKDFDGVKLICEDESWLMLRASGTEPLVRVYAEARGLTRAKELLGFGRDFIFNRT
jgi:phosphomannomutase